MENKNKVLYLLSSNASKEYMLDVLEVLSLPFGVIQHFRYQLKWLDNEVKKSLPNRKENTKISKQTKQNIKLLICYLFQEQINEKDGKWTAIYPIRTGNLVNAYKTGDEEYDIAHFYFAVDDYISECKNIIDQIPNATEPGEYVKEEGVLDKILVFWKDTLPKTSPKEKSYSAFIGICDILLRQKCFKSPDGNKEYYPLPCFVEGLESKKGRSIFPKHDFHTQSSYYRITEGSRYSLKFKIYFPEPPPEFSIIVKSDKNLFSPPPEYTFKISSRYTQENCLLISRFLERDVYTLLSLVTDCKSSDEITPLNLHINFLVMIKRHLLFRIIEVAGDIGFGVATASIALSKMLGEKWYWWYWPVIIGYGIWMVSKLIIKLLWRG